MYNTGYETSSPYIRNITQVPLLDIYVKLHKYLCARRISSCNNWYLSDLGYSGLHDFFCQNVESMFADIVLKEDYCSQTYDKILSELTLMGLSIDEVNDVIDCFTLLCKSYINQAKVYCRGELFVYIISEETEIHPYLVVNEIDLCGLP